MMYSLKAEKLYKKKEDKRIILEDERNICNGGGFNRCHVMALASCGMWEQRFKPNR